jgi:hypothetical protein
VSVGKKCQEPFALGNAYGWRKKAQDVFIYLDLISSEGSLRKATSVKYLTER